jgi:hypothetical protein
LENQRNNQKGPDKALQEEKKIQKYN